MSRVQHKRHPAKQNKTILLPVRCKLLPAIYFGCTNVNSCPLANCLQIDSLWTACRPPSSSSIVIMGGCSRLYSLCFTLWTGTGRPLPLLPSIHPPLLAPADYVCTRPHSLTQSTHIHTRCHYKVIMCLEYYYSLEPVQRHTTA